MLAGTEPVVLDGSFPAAAAAMTGERRYLSAGADPARADARRPEEAAALRTFTAVLVGGAHVPADLRSRAAEARGPRGGDVRHERDLRRLRVRRATPSTGSAC